MAKRNILDTAEQKLQKSNWPAWLPYPSCWLKSFFLMFLLRVILFVAEILAKVGYNLSRLVSSPELSVIFTTITILSPILVIAFTHHYLHLFLGRFISEIQAPEIGVVKGVIPTLMSWWEGLYGWTVIILSTFVAALLCTILLPLFNLSYVKIVENHSEFEQQIKVIFGIIYLFTGAFIYQIDYLVRHRLISIYSRNEKL
jgi:hypothetical protein